MQIDRSSTFARYRLAFIYHVRKGVPKSVTTSVTSVIKNHGDPASQGGPDTRLFVLEPEKGRATI